MKEPKAMAYVNMYGVLACLENLCEIDDEAKAVVGSLKKPVSLCFEVANGPCCTFHFSKDGCTISEGSDERYLQEFSVGDYVDGNCFLFRK